MKTALRSTLTSIFIAALFFLTLSVGNVSAYFTTDQSATRVIKNTALYTVTYSFGASKEDLYMPVFAKRDLAHGSQEIALGYELLEDAEERVSYGTATGIVLSSEEIVDNMYRIPAGSNGTFTLFVLYSVDESEPEADYALRVTELPFYRGDDRGALSLNPSELQYYITPEVELNESVKK